MLFGAKGPVVCSLAIIQSFFFPKVEICKINVYILFTPKRKQNKQKEKQKQSNQTKNRFCDSIEKTCILDLDTRCRNSTCNIFWKGLLPKCWTYYTKKTKTKEKSMSKSNWRGYLWSRSSPVPVCSKCNLRNDRGAFRFINSQIFEQTNTFCTNRFMPLWWISLTAISSTTEVNLLQLPNLASQQMGGGLWSVEAILCMAAMACPGVTSPAASRAVSWPSHWAGIQLSGWEMQTHTFTTGTHTHDTLSTPGDERKKKKKFSFKPRERFWCYALLWWPATADI